MSAPAFTPGPWSWSAAYQTTDNRPTWTLLGADGYGILSCDGDENSPRGLGNSANADLIAVAPELYESANRVATTLEMPTFCKQSTKNPNAGFVDWRDWCALQGDVKALRAALAKVISP